jgi:hypothetical protein
MATTTPNYGWDVPTSGDYVKDGAVAIETLGDDIDASLYSITSGKDVGLVHIGTTSFTSASAIIVDNVFSADFKNYRLVLNLTYSTSLQVSYRLRVGGAAISAANYNYVLGTLGSLTGSTLIATYFGRTQTSAIVAASDVSSTNVYDIGRPFETAVTTWSGTGGIHIGNGQFVAGGYNASTSATGFELNTNTGTVTGSLQVFGYKD